MRNLKASLPATMAGIASQAGLRLSFGQPRTNGSTIWVTDIPMNPSESDYNVVMGDLIHEIGHIKYTDFKTFGDTELKQALNNVFEDVRIEKELEIEFLGAKTFLDESYIIVTDNNQYRKPDSASNALTMYLLTKYMIEVNGRGFFQTINDEALIALQSYVTQAIIDQIIGLCDARVPGLVTTKDCLKLSTDVVALLQQQAEEDEKQESDSQQDSQSDSSSSEGGEESDEVDGSGSSDDDSDSEEGSESEAKGKGNGEGQGEGQGDGSDSDEESNGCSKGGAKELLESDVDEESPISLRDVAQAISDAVSSVDSANVYYGDTGDIANELRQMNGSGSTHNFYNDRFQPNLPEYNALKAAVSKDTQFLRNKLLRNWTNESRTRNIVNEHGGRFAVTEAIRCISSGEENYLVKRSKRINNKPAVCLLGDLSGSMGRGVNSLLEMQTKTMVALAETCELANVPLNILGFSDYVMPLKKWNDSMVRSRGVLGGQRTINGTQIVSAVFEGIRALAGRKESKKILIVMTDGSIGSDRLRVQSLIAFTKKHHPEIEIYGLGMGVDLRSVFPKGGQVDSTNMAQTVLNILAQ